MRIVYLTDRLDRRGGAAAHLRQVVTWAVSGGHRVTVAAGSFAAPPPEGVEAVRVRGLGTAVASPAGLARLGPLLASHDVIHVQNVMNPVALERAAATGRAVVTVQDHRFFCPGPGRTLPDGRPCRAVMSEAACAACLADGGYRARMLALTAARLASVRGARVVVLSGYMQRELEQAGLPDAVVIPPWIEPGPGREGPGRTFLLAGRLVAHKAPEDGWRAWREAGTPLPLEVAGSGPLASALEGARRLGWLDPPAFDEAIRRARAVLFPARWQEPFGIAGMEALARGVPVIVAESGGVAEWARVGCLRVAPGDVDAMAEAIRRLAEDPDLAVRLGREGRRHVLERFSRARIAPRLEAVYRLARSP